MGAVPGNAGGRSPFLGTAAPMTVGFVRLGGVSARRPTPATTRPLTHDTDG
ncbi:hypothetical protein ACFYPN_04075 [Streptomyces sp. NPDC005576]|uniref:hypothetical protein n=1 Tax=Streptomyces sp. NPDC005576 TaxID=3364726 RepID=UPI0036B10E39